MHAVWTRSHPQIWTLAQDRRPLATLTGVRWDLALVRIEGEARAFALERSGVVHPRVTVRREGSPELLATYRPHLRGGGKLRFTDGHELRWNCTRLLHLEWAWTGADGRPDLMLRPRQDGSGAEVEAPRAAATSQAPLLAALGWHLLCLGGVDRGGPSLAAIHATTTTAL